jgi:predicted enzyme related to lactoylglutathione lyase
MVDRGYRRTRPWVVSVGSYGAGTDDATNEETTMPERDGYIPGVPCWVDTSQPDPDAAGRFYADLFGWEVEQSMPDGAGGSYAMGRIRGGDVAGIGSIPPGAPQVAEWNSYVWVDSADEAAARAREAGGSVAMEPFDVADAGRMAVIVDPEGAAISVWQPRAHKGSKVVNEHGSVNFNSLATRDQQAAAEFYGALFGWQVLDLPSGPMWTLAGYGDHLEESTPGLREQMAGMGAPDGFVDVVASLQPIAADDTETPAHWVVTFAVDDVAAAATTAKELGADILNGPVDAPWTRMALVQDPQGARFIISQFVPENSTLTASPP